MLHRIFWLFSFTLFLPVLQPMQYTDASPAASETAACTRHLQAIHRALLAYRKEKGQLPLHLSDLYPRYLPDKALLHCPQDHTAGTLGDTGSLADPKLPVSYSYEASGNISNGLVCPLGTFPPSDISSGGWGTCRQVTLRQRRFYGDSVPIVRCFHHRKAGVPPSTPQIRNLTLDGSVYTSGDLWERNPAAIGAVLQRFSEDLEVSGATFNRTWKMGRLEEYSYDWLDDKLSASLRNRMRLAARLLVRRAPALSDPAAAYRLAARYFCTASDYPAAIAAAQSALTLPSESENERARLIMAESHRAQGNFSAALALYQKTLERNPDSRVLKFLIADIYEIQGHKSNAAILRLQTDPGAEMVGKPAPPINIANVAGGRIDLAHALQGKKALLVNFWFVHCSSCREEFPHLQKLYKRLGAHGLGMVAIDSDDDKATIMAYIRENSWTFPIGMASRDTHQESVATNYRVSLFPTNFLIDSQGRIVFRSAGYDEEGLLAALKKLGIE